MNLIISKMRSVWTIFLFLPTILGSYCGQNGVPFSLEVLPNGEVFLFHSIFFSISFIGTPVLGCSQPSCIAQPEDGLDDSIFETDGTGQVLCKFEISRAIFFFSLKLVDNKIERIWMIELFDLTEF